MVNCMCILVDRDTVMLFQGKTGIFDLVLSPLDVLASVSFEKKTALLQSNSLSLSAHSEENKSQKACMLYYQEIIETYTRRRSMEL